MHVGVTPWAQKDGPDDARQGGQQGAVQRDVRAIGDYIRLDLLGRVVKIWRVY